MRTPLIPITLEAIAEKTGVSPHRFAAIQKIYEDSRHDPTMLFHQLQSSTLSKQEVSAIMAYVGAVIAGKAKDDDLFIPP